MFKKLRIKNFKGWKDTDEIEMKPITLFFGSNSSGKSSIGQFLMMLKQTTQSQDTQEVFAYGDTNSAVQLGSYKDMVFEHDTNEDIIFEYQWQSKAISNLFNLGSNFINKQTGEKLSFNMLNFSARVGMNKSNNLIVKKFLYENEDKAFSLGMERSQKTERIEYNVIDENVALKRNRGRGWPPGSPIKFYGFPSSVPAYYQDADFFTELAVIQDSLFESVYYLGPLREKAKRLYTWPGNNPESVGFSGEHTIPAILSARDRHLGLRKKQKGRSFEEIIAYELQRMGLIEDYKNGKIKSILVEEIPHQIYYKVKVRTKGAKEFVDLLDTGFGVSQVLPVLVQCFYAPRDSIIIMEQPEIHLHPSAQSELADVMIDVIKSREGGNNRNIQLIIETHSEHFLQRLQRRIAEGNDISEKDVAAYFADTTEDPAKLRKLEIDEYGRISNWPQNFFGKEMEDIIEQSKAALKKRSKRSEKCVNSKQKQLL